MLLLPPPPTLHRRMHYVCNTAKHINRAHRAHRAHRCTAHAIYHQNHNIPRRCSASTASHNASTSTPHHQVGIVIVDHGSKRVASNEMLIEFVSLYQRTTGCAIVEPAHMEIAKPSIADAVDKCVARGATRIVVAPYFLSRGRHIQEDIPALVAEAQQQHPDVPCIIAEPIGVDATMAQIIHSRVAAALDTSLNTSLNTSTQGSTQLEAS